MKRMITESFEHIGIKYDSEAVIICNDLQDIERLCPLKGLFNSQQLLVSTYKDHVLHKLIKSVQKKEVFYNHVNLSACTVVSL